MGSSDEDINAEIIEKPDHEVYVDGFWIRRTPVTNAQYACCVKAGVCTKPENRDWNDPRFANRPVTLGKLGASRHIRKLGGGTSAYRGRVGKGGARRT